jgi:hypothetical protein
MNRRPACIALALALSAIGALQAQPTRPTADERYADAARLLRAQRYAAAYGRFARLADEGHAASARLALVLAEDGHALFGSAWSSSASQRRAWRALADRAADQDSADRDGGD